jgi:hypothetical protein
VREYTAGRRFLSSAHTLCCAALNPKLVTIMHVRPETSIALLLCTCTLIACADDDDGEDITEPPTTIDRLDPNIPPVTTGTWYRPGLDVTWQWQLDGTINTAYAADIYDIDLFDTPDAVIQQLHARGAKVLCYFSAGSGELGRPDYARIPRSALGRNLDGYPDERWLDIRSREVMAVMQGRLDLARQRGCDGVEPDNVTAFNNNTGFAITPADQLAFNRTLANDAHRRGLSVALKNDGDQAGQLVEYFDFVVNEQCHQYRECDQLKPFHDRGKPVLNAEYANNRAAAQQVAGSVCAQARASRTRTLILPLDLDDTFRVTCF